MFVTKNTGRNVKTKVGGTKILAEVARDETSEPIRRYAYRSFDRQWAFDDPRMAKTDSPSLWQTQSSRQSFLGSIFTKQLGSGPVLTMTTAVPDLDYFSGRGGKDIIPLWRDAAASQPNLTQGLSAMLGRTLGIAPPTVEDVAAYAYALMAHPGYQQRFATALERAGLRVPITADADLWRRTVAAGRDLMWLHSFAEVSSIRMPTDRCGCRWSTGSAGTRRCARFPTR